MHLKANKLVAANALRLIIRGHLNAYNFMSVWFFSLSLTTLSNCARSSVGTCLWKCVFITSVTFLFENWFLIWPLNGEIFLSNRSTHNSLSEDFTIFQNHKLLKQLETVVVIPINMNISQFIFELMIQFFFHIIGFAYTSSGHQHFKSLR